ncbi:MAG: trimethylamine methyltransferase, partial [Phototrophicales bacterium]
NFSEEELAVPLIKEIGPGGSFIVHPHTVKRMKTEAILTKIADRDARTIWEKKGAMDIHTRAMSRVREIMKQNTAALISAEVEEKLRAQFPGLVSGALEPIQ